MLGWALNLGFAGSGVVPTGPSTIADTKGKFLLIGTGILLLTGVFLGLAMG